ncbi:hypothetical protein ATHL_00095 [Anaerolinea thermolimosa]|nr:hypothetical protein ATHL_00095 [Anaerolinea thermolimosa]
MGFTGWPGSSGVLHLADVLTAFCAGEIKIRTIWTMDYA